MSGLHLKPISEGSHWRIRRQQHAAIHQGHIVLIEAKNRLEIVFSHLIKVKFDVIGTKFTGLNTLQQHTLATGLDDNQKPLFCINSRDAFTCS